MSADLKKKETEMSNLNNMRKQAQQMQQDMAKAQGELAETELVYEGNGVKVTVTGDMAVKKVEHTNSCLSIRIKYFDSTIKMACQWYKEKDKINRKYL